MITPLIGLAVALLVRLGFLARPLPATGRELAAPAVPLIAAGAEPLPLHPLGLPGRYVPMTGGEP
jgi:hypothetical protein